MLDPRQYPEESYEIGPVRPFLRPSVFRGAFLELCQFFFKFWYGARNPYEVLRDRARWRVWSRMDRWNELMFCMLVQI